MTCDTQPKVNRKISSLRTNALSSGDLSSFFMKLGIANFSLEKSPIFCCDLGIKGDRTEEEEASDVGWHGAMVSFCINRRYLAKDSGQGTPIMIPRRR